ncbi:MAG: hypothetical protein J6V84_02870, partial [Clostridia bacterium]|nr:hypothetical protein [Clostridia bacterium]
MKPHTFTKSQAEKAYGVSIKQGLTSEEAEKRSKADGKNILSAKQKPSFFKKLLLSLCDRMTLILLIAAVISFIAAVIGGESKADTVIILAIVVINGALGVIQ